MRAIVQGDGGDYARVKQVTIGFQAVSSILSKRVDAVPAFWNAEGVALRRRGVRTREFRVEDYGAPPYPEVVLVTARRTLERERALVDGVVAAIGDGVRSVLAQPEPAARQIAKAAGQADLGLVRAQLRALRPVDRAADAPGPRRARALGGLGRAVRHRAQEAGRRPGVRVRRRALTRSPADTDARVQSRMVAVRDLTEVQGSVQVRTARGVARARQGGDHMRRRTVRVASVVALATVGSLMLAVGADARGGPPGNLGNGLGRLLAPPAAKGRIRLDQSVLAIRDKAGRVLVDVYAADGSALATVRQRSEASGLDVVDQSAEHKILEGYVAVSDVKALAATPGVASVSQALKPFTKVGARHVAGRAGAARRPRPARHRRPRHHGRRAVGLVRHGDRGRSTAGR